MGVSFSCPISKYIDVENGLESILVKSMYFANEEVKTVVRSVSFGDGESQPTIRKSTGCGNDMAFEASVNVRTIEPATADSGKTKPEEVQSPTSELLLQVLDPSNPKHDAAIKLQKVYKSFRTRRKLADCAVLIQERWWEILDFVELKNSSISFFDEGKHETTISRWSRARTRAAKVGKGLSKNDKGQKLALQHWLEAIDPRHRYGHNLHFYYVKWLHSQSREPFFYWLDVGEGKEVNLIDKCSRSKLQQQCIKYLGPIERKAYEVSLEDGKLFYKQSGKPIHTVGEPGDVKWIFVLSTSKTMYVGRKIKGSFQHSSFLAGGAALAAGRLVVEDGILKAAWPHSGHYRPTAENFRDFLSFLQENDVDLTNVKLSPADEGEYSLSRSGTLRSNPSVEDLAQNFDPSEVVAKNITEERRVSEEKDAIAKPRSLKQSRIQRFGENLTSLEIPNKRKSMEKFESDNADADSPVGDYETTEDAFASALDKEEPKNTEEEPTQRMSEHSSCQELNSVAVRKWTTGVGARIRYVRDYPPELQARALEHVNLSPNSAGLSKSYFSPRSVSGLSPVRLSSTTPETEYSLNRITHIRPKSTLCSSLPD